MLQFLLRWPNDIIIIITIIIIIILIIIIVIIIIIIILLSNIMLTPMNTARRITWGSSLGV